MARELGYATRLAEALWEKHWKTEAPDWKPLPDLLGVLTQIDNMTTRLVRALAMIREPIPDVIADCMLKGCQRDELRAEVERLTELFALKWDATQSAETEVMRTEVERLRAALRAIADDPDTNTEAAAYARAALEPKP